MANNTHKSKKKRPHGSAKKPSSTSPAVSGQPLNTTQRVTAEAASDKVVEAEHVRSSRGAPAAAVRLANAQTPDSQLKRWHSGVGLLLALQGIALVILSTTKQLPVTAHYGTKDVVASNVAGHTVLGEAAHHLFDINVALVAGLVLLIAALGHGLMAGSWYAGGRAADMTSGVNRLRWWVYGLSGGVLLTLLGLLCGLSDVVALSLLLVTVFGGMMAGKHAERLAAATGVTIPLISTTGAVIGWLLPWLVVGYSLLAAQIYGSGVAGYMYGLCATAFAGWLLLGVSLLLQSRHHGPWRSYLFAERTAMVIYFVLVSAFGWQLFAGLLHS